LGTTHAAFTDAHNGTIGVSSAQWNCSSVIRNEEGIVDEPQASNETQPERRRRLWPRLIMICVVFIVAIALIAHFYESDKPAKANEVPPAMPVVVAVARRGNMPIYLTGLGSVTALNTVTVRSRVDGELFNVAVREGQMVTAGQLIAEIDPRPFEVQLIQAQGQKERDEATLANARIDLERYRVLVAQNAIPRQQYDTQVSTVRQLEATTKADQGAVESAQLQLVYTRITSPINGRIGLRQVDPGNIVHASDQNGIAIITQVQPINVVFTIAQDNLPPVLKKLHAGVRMPVQTFDRDFKTKIANGLLQTVDNQIDVTTGTVRLKAIFQNADDALFPNQFVNARLLLDTRRGVVLAPAAAIQHGPQNTFVFLVKPDNTVETRDVRVGLIEGEMALIEQGVSAGDVVVTQGVDKLRPGMKVSPRQENPAP
jgi:membrane fusion protein, multidrug efflux system